MATEIFTKTPDEVLDYDFDWKPLSNGKPGAESDWLAEGEGIDSFTVTAESGLTVDGYSENSGIVKGWFSGGSDGTDYIATCKIVTDAATPRTAERSIIIRIEDDRG